jgi:hypothetical protein
VGVGRVTRPTLSRRPAAGQSGIPAGTGQNSRVAVQRLLLRFIGFDSRGSGRAPARGATGRLSEAPRRGSLMPIADAPAAAARPSSSEGMSTRIPTGWLNHPGCEKLPGLSRPE